jgi:sec-independent protein translocase protein TatA
MLDSGELLVILVVAFLVFGPKRLPELARALGKLVYEIREGMRNATVEIKKEYAEIEKKEDGEVGTARSREDEPVKKDASGEKPKDAED